MSSLRKGRGSADKFSGSRTIEVYPAAKIYEEAAFIAYYLHWNHDDIMSLPHRDRLQWCKEVSKINSKLNEEPDNVFANF